MKINRKNIKIATLSVIVPLLLLSTNLIAQSSVSNINQVSMLEVPSGRVNVVIDTDTYNEIDDQFALIYALLSPEAMNVEAVYAAPFYNQNSSSAGDGMEKSYEEIVRVFNRMKFDYSGILFKGSNSFMEKKGQPVESEAARDLVARAMAATEPLYVLALGAPTNISSAILMEPKIKDKIVVVWLGGKGLNWRTASEFNLMQDILSSQLLFDSGVPLVQIPTEPVTSHLLTNLLELEAHLGNKNDIGDYLIEIFRNYRENQYAWVKEIWDISVIAYIVNPDWVPTELRSTPILTDQMTYSTDGKRPLYRVATFIHRNKVFEDMYKKISSLK